MVLLDLLTVIVVTTISTSFLYLGFKLFRRKSVIISSDFMIALVGASFLMIIIGMLIKVVTALSRNWSLLLFIPIYVAIFFFVKKWLGNLIIFNIQENILYKAISSVLAYRNLNYEKRHKTIFIPSNNQKIIVSTYQPLKSAIIHFSGNKENEFLEEITSALKQTISEKSFNEFSLVGLIYVVMGGFLFLVSLWLAIAILLKLFSAA